jgi:uncharacterized protein
VEKHPKFQYDVHMQKLGIDVDNVLADTTGIFLDELNSFYGTKIRPADLHFYDIEPVLGLSHEETKPFFHKLFKDRKLMDCAVIDGALEAVKELKKRYSIYIVTSRPKEHEDQTIEWLQAKGFPYDHVEHSIEKLKHKFTTGHGIKIFVEDDLEQAIYMAESGVKTFLIDYPWNQTLDVKKRITRVKGWPEIVKALQ